MNEIQLKYGCNPNQKPARIFMEDGSELPVTVLNGRPGYINFLDALNGWQLVSELKRETGLPAATSFKHVSPAGAAVGLPLTETLRKIYWVDDMKEDLSPLACAYVRARGADRMSSFGDFISLSDICDEDTASVIHREVSDGVIAPGYTEKALEILKGKKKGNYVVIQIDPAYQPAAIEHKQVFGVTFEQGRQNLVIDDAFLSNIVTKNKELTPEAATALYTGMVTDSGRFRYDATTARTFRLASFLREQPVDTEKLYRDLYSVDLSQLKLKAEFINRIQLTEHGVAYIRTTREELNKLGCDSFTASRGMVGVMADVTGVDIWVNFTETEQGILCELRSSPYNINPIAVKYGGGGHAKASGATLKTWDDAERMLADLDEMVGHKA